MEDHKVTDGGGSDHLKYQSFIDDIPGVDKGFFNRCYNAADSGVYRGSLARKDQSRKGAAEEARASRISGVTYLKALRKLARRVCLEPSEQLPQGKIDEITRTREFLDDSFFNRMGFYGVHIVRAPGQWTWTESVDAQFWAGEVDISVQA